MMKSTVNQALKGISSIMDRAAKNQISLTPREATAIGIAWAVLLERARPPAVETSTETNRDPSPLPMPLPPRKVTGDPNAPLQF